MNIPQYNIKKITHHYSSEVSSFLQKFNLEEQLAGTCSLEIAKKKIMKSCRADYPELDQLTILWGVYLEEELLALFLSDESTDYPCWTLSVTISEVDDELLYKNALSEIATHYEKKSNYCCWVAVSEGQNQEFTKIRNNWPTTYCLNLEAISEKGSRPYYSWYWRLLDECLPNSNTHLYAFRLRSSLREIKIFEELYHD